MDQLTNCLGHARVPAKAESVSHNLINWVMTGVAKSKLLVILYTALTPFIDTRISDEAETRRGTNRRRKMSAPMQPYITRLRTTQQVQNWPPNHHDQLKRWTQVKIMM